MPSKPSKAEGETAAAKFGHSTTKGQKKTSYFGWLHSVSHKRMGGLSQVEKLRKALILVEARVGNSLGKYFISGKCIYRIRVFLGFIYY